MITEYSGLTFDWDDVSIDDEEIVKWLDYLCNEFGNNLVWYRESSSRTGLHVIIGDLIFDAGDSTTTARSFPLIRCIKTAGPRSHCPRQGLDFAS